MKDEKVGLYGFDLYLPQPTLNDWHAFTTDYHPQPTWNKPAYPAGTNFFQFHHPI